MAADYHPGGAGPVVHVTQPSSAWTGAEHDEPVGLASKPHPLVQCERILVALLRVDHDRANGAPGQPCEPIGDEGPSKPSAARSAARSAGRADSPNMISTGSPGTMWIRRNTRQTTPKTTNVAVSKRERTKLNTVDD